MEKLVRFDWAIKHILRDKANFDILEGFLSALLKQQIRILNLLESESNQEDEADKFNRVDLLTENQNHDLILIEVQVKSELDFFHRIAYGTAKLLTEYMQKGSEYRELKKVVSVSIAYFSLGTGTDYLYHGATRFTGVHHGDELALSKSQVEEFGIHEVHGIFPEYYLIRTGKFGDEVRDPTDEWIYMLKHSEVKPEFRAEHIQQAGERLRVMKLPAERRKAYDRFMDNRSYEASMLYSAHVEGWQEGREEGREEGRKEGREEGHKEGFDKGHEKGLHEGLVLVAKNMLAQGRTAEAVAAVTGLSMVEIEKLSG